MSEKRTQAKQYPFFNIYFLLTLCIISAVILGYGENIMAAMIMGIITIPIAFFLGAIPLLCLILVLAKIVSIPLSALRRIPNAINFLLSLTLSAALLFLVPATVNQHLYSSAQQFKSGDKNELDIRQIHSLVVFQNRVPKKCDAWCKDLLVTGNINSIVISADAFNPTHIQQSIAGTQFTRLAVSPSDCEELVDEKNSSSERQGLCVRKTQVKNFTPEAALVSEMLSTSQLTFRQSFNPFALPISAKRFSIYRRVQGSFVEQYRTTNVEIKKLWKILWPISIGNAPQIEAEFGFIRFEETIGQRRSLSSVLNELI